MPRGVSGTGVWKTVRGQMVWVEGEAESTAAPKKRTGIRTPYKDEAPPPPPSTQKKRTAPRSPPRYKASPREELTPQQTGPTAAEQAQAAAAKAAAERRARIAARQARIIEQARKRGSIIAARIDRKVASIEAAQQQIETATKTIDEQIKRARAIGAPQATITGLVQLRDQRFKQWVDMERAKGEAAQGIVRARSNAELRLSVAGKGVGEKLTPREKRNLAIARKKERAAAVRNSAIPQLARAKYSTKKAGDKGRAKEIQSAVRAVTDYQMTHPDDFDESVLLWLGDQQLQHEKAISSRLDKHSTAALEISKKLNEERKAIKAGKSPRRYNQLVKRANSLTEKLKKDGVLQEMRALWGRSSSNIKGTKVRYKGGAVNFYVERVNATYAAAEKRQREILFGSGILGDVRAISMEVRAGVAMAHAEATRHQVKNPVTGKMELQTAHDRLIEIYEESGISQAEANELGQAETRDFTALANDYRNDPILRSLFNRLIEHGITDNHKLAGDGFDMELIESRIIPEAIDEAWSIWVNSPDYNPPGVRQGIFDSSRYGYDEEGRYFVLDDGSIVRPGDPLPAGQEVPRWDLDADGPDLGTEIGRALLVLATPLTLGASAAIAPSFDLDNSFARAQAEVVSRYEQTQKQAFEDTYRAQLGILDPGFLGDVFRLNAVGDLVSSMDAIPGGAALAILSALDSELLLNFDGAPADAVGTVSEIIGDAWDSGFGLSPREGAPKLRPLKTTEERLSFIEQNPELFKNHDVVAVGRASDLDWDNPPEILDMLNFDISPIRPIIEGFNNLGFDAGIGVAYDKDTDDMMVTFLYKAPVFGAVEFGVRKSPEISEDLSQRRADVQRGLQEFQRDPSVTNLMVTARVLGTNELVTIGNGAGLATALWYVFIDPTNFFPGITFAKKGLGGIRAAAAAGGAVPPGLNRLANMVKSFSTGFAADPKLVESYARMTRDFKKLSPGLTTEQQARSLQAIMAGIDDTAGVKAMQDQLTQLLDKHLAKGSVDTKQLHAIAEEVLPSIMMHRGWVIRSQAEEIALATQRMDVMTKQLVQEQKTINDTITARNLRAIDALEKEGAAARRQAANVRRLEETFEARALKISHDMPLEQIEKRAVSVTDPQQRRLYERARTLARERRGGTLESGGAISAGPTGSKRINLDELREAEALKAQKRARRLSLADKDAARRAAEADELKRVRAARAERLAKRKNARLAEQRMVEARDFGRANEASTRIKRVRAKNSLTRRSLRKGGVPDAWGRSDGPHFWGDIIARGLSGKQTAKALVSDTLDLVEAVAIRHGRWSDTVPARRVFFENVLSQRLTPSWLKGERGRLVFKQMQKLGSTRFKSFDEFVDVLSKRKRQSWQDLAGDELYVAYEEAVGRGLIPAASAHEATTIFLARQQFNPAATADEAIVYLRTMEKFGESGPAWGLVSDMFVDDLNTFHQRVIQSALSFSDSQVDELLDSPMKRLDDYMSGTIPRENAFVRGEYKLDPSGVIVGWEGRSTDEALIELEKAVSTAGHISEESFKAIDQLAMTLLYDSLGSNDFRLAGDLLQTLSKSPYKSKAGRLARLIRERMHKELDVLGIDLRATTPASDIAFEGGIVGKSGRFVAGQNRAGKIVIDRALIAEKFNRKSWTNPRPLKDGTTTKALPADEFKTYQDFEQFVIRHERVHSVEKRLPGETMGDYETRINDIALDPREYGPRGLSTDYPGQPTSVQKATAQAKALMNRMGQSEGVWLETRIKRNRSYINNKSTTAIERKRLLSENKILERAYEDYIARATDGYKAPALSYDEAAAAAEAARDELHELIPPSSYAYYAETPQAAQVEVMRNIHAAMVETPIAAAHASESALEAILDWFPMARYNELNGVVQKAIQNVQAKRSAKVGLKKLNTDTRPATHISTIRDFDPVIVKAKEDAIKAWCKANGLPDLHVDAYDRFRTMLSSHIQKGVRAQNVADEARALGGDFSETFVSLRSALADEDAVESLKWMLLKNPGMTPDEALRTMTLAYTRDGVLRPPRKTITLADQRILREFFEQSTGVKVTDPNGVNRVLTSHGTKPNFESKFEFRSFMERVGAWSPRKASQIDETRPAWSLAEEREFFMNRYGEAPAWVTDKRIISGEFLYSRDAYYQTMVDVGSFDEKLRVARALGEENRNVNFGAFADELSYGSDTVKAVVDLDVERRWLVQRYGDLVGKIDAKGNVTLHNAPWLMNEKEMGLWRQNMAGVDVGNIITNADELAEVRLVAQRLGEKYADLWIKTAGVTDPDLFIVPSSVVHRIAFEMVREMAITTPWRSFYQRITKRNLLDAWSYFWRATVISNPAFTISNMVDTPSKAVWFRLSNRFAVKPSQKWKELIPEVERIGLEGTAYFPYSAGNRSLLERIGRETSYGNLDRARAIGDTVLTGVSRNVLPRIEKRVKRDIARSIATGLDETFRPKLIADGIIDEAVQDALIMLETRRTVLKLFPSLDDAGLAERMLNKVFPFISYNFKNKALWMGEIVEHPWLVPIIQNLQGGLISWNQNSWNERHPGMPMPENLTHQIRIPGTDIYLDIGMFTDAARGAAPLIGKGVGDASVTQLIGTFIRPLPSQTAAAQAFLYNITGGELFKRYKWAKIIGEDGFWTGEWEQITVPPGTPWGDRPLDVLRDYMWPFDFGDTVIKALEDGNLTYEEVVRVIGDFIDFGQLAEPNRYYILNQQYFALTDVSDEAARAWLKTEDGQELQEMWNQHYWEPTGTKLDPFAFPFIGPDSKPDAHMPDPLEIRKRWLGLQPPETRKLFFDAWQQARWADEYWDEQLDTAVDQDVAELYRLRETWFTQFYHEHPYLWRYAAMGMTPEEFADFKAKFLIDRKRSAFFSTYGWENAPTDPKELEKWQKERVRFLEANPEIFETIVDVKDSYTAAVERRDKLWDKNIRLSEALDRIQHAIYESETKADDKFLKEARDLIGRAFDIEAFGFDAEAGKFRAKADSLTAKIRRAGGDADAIAEAAYAQRLQAVSKASGGDPLAWHKILDRNKDLRELYFQRNPEKRATWQRDGKVLEFWGRFNRLADKGRWDEAWDSWDELPPLIREHIREQNPDTFRKMEQTSRYSGYMQRWVSLFDSAGPKAAMAYFHSLPSWVQERYYSNHPGRRFGQTSGRGSAYITMLNNMFDQIDAGNWDAGEKIWNSAPAWMRRRYYANNPDSKLFRGGSGSYSGSGGGIPDAQYKSYVRMMKQWVDLLKDGKDEAATKYFKSLPKWAQDFYLARHPDKELMREDDKMLQILEDYFSANKATQKAMLQHNPKLTRWLQENDTQAAWQNAVTFIYQQLPDDPWLRRVYRDKYPEIFSKEAQGKQKRQSVADTLAEHPEFSASWEKWYRDIMRTLEEAMKYSLSRPKQVVVDHSYQQRADGHKGRSAAEVAEDVRSYPLRMQQVAKRMPKLDA